MTRALPLLLLLAGCGTSIAPVLPVSECLTLLPASVTGPTPKVPLPPVRTAGTLAAFADATEGQLDRANADKAEIVEFEGRCRERDRQLVKVVTRKGFFARLFG